MEGKICNKRRQGILLKNVRGAVYSYGIGTQRRSKEEKKSADIAIGEQSEDDKKMGKKTIHILSNTHWDREWRFPLEETRLLLVKLLDRLINLMETDPEYKYFNFDSQTIFLEDYLEFRPENRERLKKLISDGRLIVGPWYTLPEEHCVGEESLVRNLLMGKKIAEEFGRCSRAGYTPTSYGQISQMAQLYSGFGIDGIIFYRGIDSKECTQEYFLEAPDGSRIMGIRLSRFVSRGAFYLYVSARTMHEADWDGYHWGDEGCLPIHLNRADEDHEEEPHIIISPYRKDLNLDVVEDGIQKAMEDILEAATCDTLVLMDGMDSVYPNENLPQILAKANEVNPEWEFIHSSLPNFIEDLRKNINPEKMTILKGERRHPSKENKFNAFLKDSISSRMYIKQRNAEAERSLLRWAEPFSTIVGILYGVQYPLLPLTKAWKYLLSSHSHDSIGGLSPDQIHKDMMYRFDQAEVIGKALTKEALGLIVSHIDTSGAEPGDVLVTVFNPLPFEHSSPVSVFVDFPREKNYRGFRIYDPEGNTAEQQILSREESYLIATEPNEMPMTFLTTKWKIAFDTGKLPALGFKTFTIKPLEQRITNYGTMVCGSNEMENEYLKVKIHPNGTLKVSDKKTGQSYSNLLWFEDAGDWGDPWTRFEPFGDRVYNTIGCHADIRLVENGPVVTSFEIILKWSLPEGIDYFTKRRSENEKEVSLKSKVSLKKGVPRLMIDIEVDNTVKYHKLRVMFDSGFNPEEAVVHGQFDVIRRKVHMPDTSEWLEPMTGTNPYYGFAGVENGCRGMAAISNGLTEYEVLDNASGTIALTLLRTYGYPKMSGLLKEDRVVREGNEGTQCLGVHKYPIALYFYQGAWDKSGLIVQEAAQRNPTMTVQHSRYEGKGLSMCESFLRLEPENLYLTGIKQAEDGKSVIVRFYNPTEETVEGLLLSHARISRARLLKLDEVVLEDIAVVDGQRVILKVPKKKIITLGLEYY